MVGHYAFVPVLLSVLAVVVVDARNCGPCDPAECEPPTGCLAGMIKDPCGCCYVCGRLEGEKCDNDKLPLPYDDLYGHCGEHLECRLRDDLKSTDLPEALCFCKYNETLCASDGKTYSNMCAMMEVVYKRREKLVTVSRGPCKAEPWVATGPEDQAISIGSSAALSCEVMGYPIPTVEWQQTKPDGTTIDLPSDNHLIAVQARGGPERYEVTGWLQILDFQPEDAGQYHCVARNSEGEAKSTAVLTISDKHYKRNDDIFNNINTDDVDDEEK